MASPSLAQYLRALERTPPTTQKSHRKVRVLEVLSEAGTRQKQADDQRIATRRQQWKDNDQLKKLAAGSKAGKKKPAAESKSGKKKPAAELKSGKKTGAGARGKKATESKEQTGVPKQRTLLQAWPQQKPTSKSRTVEEDDDEDEDEDEEQRKPTKRRRIF